MSEAFEDHCWRDVIPDDTLKVYSSYERRVFVGPAPALVAIDLYEGAYAGGPRYPIELTGEHPNSCGVFAHNAIEPTVRLFAAARGAGVPVFYSTGEVDARPQALGLSGTLRRRPLSQEADFAIRADFAPAEGDRVIAKRLASAFYGTYLLSYLVQQGIQTLIMFGESTSGCVRASVVDAFSFGFHVVVVEECCFDRSELSHKVNLFDMHHKYADVMHVDEVIDHLRGFAEAPALRERS